MDSKALLRINSLLKHIDLVLTDMKDIDFAHFEEDSLLFRATCFSVSQIGEQMARLQEKIGDKYPDLPWSLSRRMRNFIVHDYENVNPLIVFSTVIKDLLPLKEAFLIMKKDYEKKTV